MKTSMVLFCMIIVNLITCYSFASDQTSYQKVGSCGLEDVYIFYEFKKDYVIGCEGVARALEFFTVYGYAVDIPIYIYFGQRVTVNDNSLATEQKSIYGYFDPENMIVYMSSLTSPFVTDPKKVYLRVRVQQQNGFRKQHILEEFHRSIVAHEIAHLLTQHNFNLQFVAISNSHIKMGRGVQEYIASVVQLATMEPSLRKSILERYDPQIIIDHEQQINGMLFSCNPQQFSIMSYRHFHLQNRFQQNLLLDRIFSNDLNPDLAFEIDL